MAFDEHLPVDPTSAALRIAAFTLTILSGVLVAGAEVTHKDDRAIWLRE